MLEKEISVARLDAIFERNNERYKVFLNRFNIILREKSEIKAVAIVIDPKAMPAFDFADPIRKATKRGIRVFLVVKSDEDYDDALGAIKHLEGAGAELLPGVSAKNWDAVDKAISKELGRRTKLDWKDGISYYLEGAKA